MKISISNIAWEAHQEKEVADLMQRFNIQCVDVAPGKYFSNLLEVAPEEIRTVRDFWEKRGIEIVAMQSLLFGVGFNMFNKADQGEMLNVLDCVCSVGAGLGAKALVFGSPKNRDRSGVAEGEVAPLAVDFFRRLGDCAVKHQVTICLEPNPVFYGANFMMNSAQTAAIVRQVNHPAILMNLDTGAILMNGESAADAIVPHADLFGHIHASEPQLVPLGSNAGAGKAAHQALAAAINRLFPEKVLSVEMLTKGRDAPMADMETAMLFALELYGDKNDEN